MSIFLPHDIKEAIDIATTKLGNNPSAGDAHFKYLCGILHNKKRQKENPECYEVLQYWKRNHPYNYIKESTLTRLTQHYGASHAKSIIDEAFKKPRQSYIGYIEVHYLEGIDG